jgi:hypothetical protein
MVEERTAGSATRGSRSVGAPRGAPLKGNLWEGAGSLVPADCPSSTKNKRNETVTLSASSIVLLFKASSYVDYVETFALVARLPTICATILLCTNHKLTC